jgi:hypothetical protein
MWGNGAGRVWKFVLGRFSMWIYGSHLPGVKPTTFGFTLYASLRFDSCTWLVRTWSGVSLSVAWRLEDEMLLSGGAFDE